MIFIIMDFGDFTKIMLRFMIIHIFAQSYEFLWNMKITKQNLYVGQICIIIKESLVKKKKIVIYFVFSNILCIFVAFSIWEQANQ